MHPNIQIFPNINELSCAAADIFIESANRAINANDCFTVALAGGSTPKFLYKLLASAEYKAKVDWTKTFFFWGDERCVPIDSDESNFKMASENLLLPAAVPANNIRRFNTELEPDRAAVIYETTLETFFQLKSGELPRFDLILLGMGADGHTASIFPHTAAVGETSKLAIANFVPKFDAFRLTLTPPVINNAAQVVFLISGADKADALNEVINGARQPELFPSQLIQPANGELSFLVDAGAAAKLQK
jgi:6-phosphogluconolactonase